MDLALSSEQEQLVDSFGALFSKSASPERVRAAEPVGFDADLWTQLVEVGVVAMALDEAHGGWGATVVDLALVAELAGSNVVPAPIVEAQVAARLLAASGSAAAAELLPGCVDGTGLVTIALHPAVAATLPLVPAGAIADHVVALDGDRLVVVPTAGQDRRHVDNLGALPLADLEITGDVLEIAAGADATARFERAIDEWLALTASALVGVGARAQDMATEYAVERRAWGVPIGTFQGVSHPLADSATALDGARLLARKAAWCADVDDDRRAELAAMAFGFAAETSRDATYRSLHIHGGYGFMLEHDVQLHYRRARGWARVWGDTRRAYQRAATHRYADHLAGGN
jgi:alkylation response protein AidB-like acyl-CoA dehydrogenase